MLILASGHATVELGQKSIDCGPGECIGELALILDDVVHVARVRAVSEVRGIAISRQDFTELLAADADIAGRPAACPRAPASSRPTACSPSAPSRLAPRPNAVRPPISRGGRRVFSTRSTRGRSPTPTATASVICAASSTGSTTSMAGCRRTLAEPDHGVAQCRLGLRRRRLLARSSPISEPMPTSTPHRRSRATRDPHPARLRAESHERPAPVVRRVPIVANGAPPRLVPLGRSRGRRLATQQLGQQLRRAGLDARRHDRPVLHAQPPELAARSQLVERRSRERSSTTSCGSGSTAASPAFASTCATSSSRTRCCGTTRPRPRERLGRGAALRAASRVQHESPRDARCDPAVARDRRLLRPAATAPGRDAGRGPREARRVPRRRRRVAPRVQLRVHQRAARGRSDARHRRGDGGAAPAERMAGVDRIEPRHVPLPDALGRRRSAQDPGCARDAVRTARHAGALSRRRDRPGRHRGRSHRICAIRSACSTGPPTPDAMPGARRCSGATRPGGGFTTPGATPWLPLGDTAQANVASQRDDPGSPLTLTRALIALRRSDADLQRGAYESVAAADGVWTWRRGAHALVAINMSERPTTLDGVRGRLLIGTDLTRVGERLSGTVQLGAWEAVIAELAGFPGDNN